MADILLTTFNARYIHTATALYWLLANLGDLQDHAELVEYDLKQSVETVAEELLSKTRVSC